MTRWLNHIKPFIFLPFLLLQSLFIFSQSTNLDSLRKALINAKNDSVRVFVLQNLGNEYFSYDTLKSREYLEQGYTLAKKMNYDYAIANYYMIKGMLKQLASDNDLAMLLFDTSVTYFTRTIDKRRTKQEVDNARLSIATIMGQKADILAKQGKMEEAITTYFATLEAWKSSNDPRKIEAIGTYYTKISTTYYDLNDFKKALEYDKLSLVYRLQDNNEEATAYAYLYICDDFAALNQPDSSILYLQKAKPIVEQLNNHKVNVQYYNKLAQASRKKNNFRTAIGYYGKVISEATINNAKIHIIASNKMIAICYKRLGEFNKSREHLLLALPEAIAGKYLKERREILDELVRLEDTTKNYLAAYSYLKLLTVLKDSIDMEKTKKGIAEIENKYQASEKEKNIIRLQNEKKVQALTLRQKSTLNYFLFGSVIALLVVIFLGYRNLRHRRQLAKQQHELQQQQIRELEKDKQLVAVDSMLKGQEDERSRLAKDLHDGLGGLLSGVKFSLSNMKDNFIVTPDNMAVFERSLDMIDTSIRELRRVAHNMMPEMLVKFGLDEALKEYCNMINGTKLIEVKYQSFGMETRMESSTEIIMYRIVQELLNNILKHAVASEALVQVIREDGRLSIVVEDNGKGFETSSLEASKGAGWTSIRSRVDYLKGQLEVHSEPGKGTTVNIEFNV